MWENPEVYESSQRRTCVDCVVPCTVWICINCCRGRWRWVTCLQRRAASSTPTTWSPTCSRTNNWFTSSFVLFLFRVLLLLVLLLLSSFASHCCIYHVLCSFSLRQSSTIFPFYPVSFRFSFNLLVFCSLFCILSTLHNSHNGMGEQIER